MKSGKQYDELSSFFAAHKTEIPDNGFSRRVVETLPNRSYLPVHYVALTVGAIAALAVVFFMGSDVADVAADLVHAACTLSAPSPVSLLTYLGMVGLLSTVGFAVYYES